MNYYRYTGTTFGGTRTVLNKYGFPNNQKPGDNTPFPGWSALASNSNVPRGVLPGRPRSVTEALPGGCFDYYDGEIPNVKVVPLADYKHHTASRKSDFEQAQKSGKIVLNPMVAETSTLTLNPGPGDISPGPVVKDSFSAPSVHELPHTLSEVNPQNGYPEPGYGIYMSVGGLPLDFPFRNGSSLTTAVARHYDRFHVDKLVMPPEGIGREAYGKIHSILSAEYDTGLITSAIADANSGIADLLTELGEAKETIGYIVGLLGSIIDLVVKLKKDLRRARHRPGATTANVASELASIWMQFRYAVSPIGYSINDALDYLQSSYSPYQSFRKGNSTTHKIELSNGWVCSDLEVIDRVFVKYRYGYESATHGLKTNFLATAWELTFLSFVVDWVLNVGDYLTALGTPSAVVDSGIQYSRQVRQTTLLIHKPGSYEGTMGLDLRYYSARPIQKYGHIGLSIDPSMTWKRWLDAISLTWLLSKDKLKSK